MNQGERVRREVVSFVRRSARMNDSQQKAWDTLRDRFVIEVQPDAASTSIHADASIDWDAAFGRSAPRICEIGSGIGDSLVPMAAARPEVDFIAFEVFLPAVASTIGRMNRHGVDNIRVVTADGAAGLSQLVADESLTELWTFFADPWHKVRHHKRRLVSAEFAAVVARKLRPGGRWRLATDWADYADWMREQLDGLDVLTNDHDGWAPRYAARPVTKYEAKGLEAGRQVFDLTYSRPA